MVGLKPGLNQLNPLGWVFYEIPGFLPNPVKYTIKLKNNLKYSKKFLAYGGIFDFHVSLRFRLEVLVCFNPYNILIGLTHKFGVCESNR